MESIGVSEVLLKILAERNRPFRCRPRENRKEALQYIEFLPLHAETGQSRRSAAAFQPKRCSVHTCQREVDAAPSKRNREMQRSKSRAGPERVFVAVELQRNRLTCAALSATDALVPPAVTVRRMTPASNTAWSTPQSAARAAEDRFPLAPPLIMRHCSFPGTSSNLERRNVVHTFLSETRRLGNIQRARQRKPFQVPEPESVGEAACPDSPSSFPISRCRLLRGVVCAETDVSQERGVTAHRTWPLCKTAASSLHMFVLSAAEKSSEDRALSTASNSWWSSTSS